jgi:prepilin peptidase CpaA
MLLVHGMGANVALMILYITVMVLNGLVAIYDFSFYRIPNMLVLTLIVTYFTTAPFFLGTDEILISAGIFAGALAIGFGLFFVGLFGGGDAKYLAATAMWAGSEHIIPFIIIVALAGGVLALGYLFAQPRIVSISTTVWSLILALEKRYRPLQCVWAFSGCGPETTKREAIKHNQLPYGIAISFGMVVVLYIKLTS